MFESTGQAPERQNQRLSEDEQYRVTLESIGDGVIATDVEGKITFLNSVAESLTGFGNQEAEGRHFHDVFNIIDEQTRAPMDNPVARVLRDGNIERLVNGAILIDRNGSERVIDDSAAPIRDAQGNLTGVVVIFRDVSQRRMVERGLATLAAIVESSDDAIVGKTLDGVITSWNAGAERIFGYTAAEAVGSPITMLIPPDNHAEETEILARLRGGKRVEHKETIRIRKDGQRINVSLTSSPIRDSTGKIVGASKIARDITEQKRAAEEARRRQEWFRVTLSSIGDGVVAVDPLGRISFMNPIAEVLTGWTAEEATGHHYEQVLRFIHEISRDPVENPITQVIRDGRVVNLANHTLLVAKNGAERPIDDSGAPIREQDEVIGAVLVFRDVTRRRQAENRLQESESRFRNLADAAPVLIWISDCHRNFSYFNQRWLEFTGRTLEQEIRSGWADSIHPADLKRCERTFVEAYERREPFGLEYRMRRYDGEYRWFVNRGVPHYGPEDEFIGFVGGCTDITDKVRIETELRALNETLEQRVAERTAIAEHRAEQLRALTIELTQTEQRERQRLGMMLHDHIQQLLVATKYKLAVAYQREGETFQQTIRDAESLLSQAIEASRSLSIELSPPVLHDRGLASALAWIARWMQDKHGLTVHLDVDPDADASSEELRIILFQAVRELLFNVVKHAQVREARVSLALCLPDEIQITVQDQGAGFDPSALERIGGTTPGFGLLSLRERLLHVGGRLQIVSAPGGGTRSIIRAPLLANKIKLSLSQQMPQVRPATAHTLPSADPAAAEIRLRVMLVDDHKIVREGIAGLLREQPGIEIVGEAADGQSAIKMAYELQPDVIVMDVSLPVINGVEATTRIRRGLNGVRIIGLSMYHHEEMAASMVEAGADAYLPKDGPLETLVTAIRGTRKTQ